MFFLFPKLLDDFSDSSPASSPKRRKTSGPAVSSRFVITYLFNLISWFAPTPCFVGNLNTKGSVWRTFHKLILCLIFSANYVEKEESKRNVVDVIDCEKKDEEDWLPPPPQVSGHSKKLVEEDSTIKEWRCTTYVGFSSFYIVCDVSRQIIQTMVSLNSLLLAVIRARLISDR